MYMTLYACMYAHLYVCIVCMHTCMYVCFSSPTGKLNKIVETTRGKVDHLQNCLLFSSNQKKKINFSRDIFCKHHFAHFEYL